MMIKLTFCLRRQKHLTLVQFQEYWLNQHATLVKQHAATLNIRRYVQHHTLDDRLNEAMRKSRGAPEPFDGIAELWFDSIQSMTAPGATPQGKAANAALKEDEARFIDLALSPLWIGKEYTLIGS
jgi:uncharacterized protein (TIGR02118 family)